MNYYDYIAHISKQAATGNDLVKQKNLYLLRTNHGNIRTSFLLQRATA